MPERLPRERFSPLGGSGRYEFRACGRSGSETYGICQNPYLAENFKVVRYILKLKLNGDGSFDYEQDTQLQIKGRGLLHHTDANHLKRIS